MIRLYISNYNIVMGNPSFPAFTLSVLTLHAIISSATVVDNNRWNRSSSNQKHHLRHRQADDSQESPPASESKGIAQSSTSIIERVSDGTQRRQESCLWHAVRFHVGSLFVSCCNSIHIIPSTTIRHDIIFIFHCLGPEKSRRLYK